MATGTVADERTERKRELETAKNELETAMARYAAAEVAASAGGGPDSHPALADRRIRRTALSSARSGLEAAYRADRSDCGSGNAPACAGCGERMRHVGRGGSPVETAPGRVEVPMARHACAACRKTVRPRERALDIEGSTTPAARRMASLAGSSCCHGEADRLLAELAEVNFGAKARRGRRGVERTTRLVGDDAESRRKAALSGALSAASGAGGGGAPARKPLKDGGILCVALDGTGVPARPSETAGRAGKDGGRAGTREAKVGAPWLLEPDGEGGMRTADGSVRYFAGVESAEDDAGGDSPVARRLLRELAAAGHAPDDVGACIGDGAEWLRRLFDEWFPNAVPIVDFLHASEYLWAAAGARHRADDGRAKRWATEPCRLLKEGDAGKVVAALRRAGGEECGRAARHIGERRDRMRYDEHPARGLPIGSGRVEAACRTVVGRRMKCTGMRWSVDGQPRAVGALRAAERLVRRLLGRTASTGRVTVSASLPRICRTPANGLQRAPINCLWYVGRAVVVPRGSLDNPMPDQQPRLADPKIEWHEGEFKVCLPVQGGIIDAKWRPTVTSAIRIREIGTETWSPGFETPLHLYLRRSATRYGIRSPSHSQECFR